MVKLKVVNWRCIEDLELELARINVLIGPNSTGKSSLAYAIYFASKSTKVDDPRSILIQMYGHDFNEIARLVENKPQFPISIKIDGSEFSVNKKEQGFEINKLPSSPWVDEFLLPSKRVNYIQIVILLRKIIGELKGKPEAAFIGSFAGALVELFKTLPLFPPFGVFAMDYTRALTGFQLTSVKGGLKDVGSYMVNIHPLLSFVELTIQDPYTKLQLPPELAPDGLLDFSIFDSMMKNIPENSLVVIEEPEIHKNPLAVKEFTEHIVKKVLNKKTTLIMTTHSDLPLITMGKLITEKVLKPEEIKVYYFKRDPWSKIFEIKVYEDGTLESLPDTEELIARLF
jgi:energy-coupling factor transporter ATP-binding protein EcfA2